MKCIIENCDKKTNMWFLIRDSSSNLFCKDHTKIYDNEMSKNDKLIDKYKGIYKEIKAKECIESKIIKLADFIDVIIYSKIENKLGNSSIIKEYNNSTKRFNELLEKILNYYDGE
jgi:hypothetical protein